MTIIREKILKKDEIIPMTFDYIFTSIFNNEENMSIIENFLSIFLEIDIIKIKGHVTILNRKQPLEHRRLRQKEVDLLLDYEGEKINIELNNSSSKNVIERNIVYISNVHGRQL